MITANKLWDLYKDVDNNLSGTDEQTWTGGQREHLSWRNYAPTTPDPGLIAALEEDILVISRVIGELKRGWELGG